MALATKLFKQSGEDLQHALDQVAGLQERIVILDNDKLPYDQAINKLDQDLFDQCLDVNKAFGVVETAYQARIDNGCRSDLFWRVVSISDAGDGTREYSLLCTKLNAGGYPQKFDFTYPSDLDEPNYFGNECYILRPDGTRLTVPINRQNARGLGVGYTFGFEPRNFYGLKYYNEPYSDDIGNTLVAGFIGTITQGESTLTIMNPVGAGISQRLEVGQIIQPQNSLQVFTGTAKITGITTGLTDLRNIESIPVESISSVVGTADTLSFVNIITVDKVASRSVRAPLNDGGYGSFDILDDPANFADQGRQKYSLSSTLDPFLPQTVGIMQTANMGIGVSVALDNSGYPSASMGWDPNLQGYVVDYSSNGTPLAGPIEPPKVGSGICFWKAGFDYKPLSSPGGTTAATEGDTVTIEVDDADSMYALVPQGSCTAFDTAITDAIGIATAKETAIRGANDTTNPTKVEGLNALRGERNDHYSLPIWGMRCGIGAENLLVDRLSTLQAHLDDLTIRNVVDA